MVFAAPMASSLQTTFRGLIAKSYQIPTDGAALTALMKTLAFDVAAAFGLPLLVLCVAAFAGNIVQHRIVFTTESLKPQLSRISPMAGFARLFSKQALANFAKGLAKLAWSVASWRRCCGRSIIPLLANAGKRQAPCKSGSLALLALSGGVTNGHGEAARCFPVASPAARSP